MIRLIVGYIDFLVRVNLFQLLIYRGNKIKTAWRGSKRLLYRYHVNQMILATPMFISICKK